MSKALIKVAKPKRPPISISVQLNLWVKAGGRCQFHGCNEYLLVDGLTLKEANYSNIAHIVGWSTDGPRGNDPLSAPDRNKVENLLLLCPTHHKLVDSKEHEAEYPRDLLLAFKKTHEDRIFKLTAAQPPVKTTVIRLKANIGNEVVEIPSAHIENAIFPFYRTDPRDIEIDLSKFNGDDGDAYWEFGQAAIADRMADVYRPKVGMPSPEHISVFAIGPMPFLIHLGNSLSNKIPTQLFQRHRDTQNWTWKDGDGQASYKTTLVRVGTDPLKVALIVSLSGTIDPGSLPEHIDAAFSVYEITLADGIPNPLFLNTKPDLDRFRAAYQLFLRQLRKDHPSITKLHLFPAVPAPIAVLCGAELMRKVDPRLIVYDNNKQKGGFKQTLEVN